MLSEASASHSIHSRGGGDIISLPVLSLGCGP